MSFPRLVLHFLGGSWSRVSVSGGVYWWHPGWRRSPAYLGRGRDPHLDPRGGRTHAANGGARRDDGRQALPAAVQAGPVVHLAVGRGEPLGRGAAAHFVGRGEQPEFGLAVEVPAAREESGTMRNFANRSCFKLLRAEIPSGSAQTFPQNDFPFFLYHSTTQEWTQDEQK